MTRVRFLHTSDWQIGMPALFLEAEARTRYAAARLDAVRRLAAIAKDTACEFVVVAGDIFDANQLTRTTIARALEAMRAFEMPLYLLPGNHDCYDAGSIYRTAEVKAGPSHIRVLSSAGTHQVRAGVEIVAAPWFSKVPSEDLIAAQCEALTPAPVGTLRILLGHGQLDSLAPDVGRQRPTKAQTLQVAVADGRLHYVALGDRHSRTDAGIADRVWYSGTPEVTDFDEKHPGDCLVVELDDDECTVTERRVGTWAFSLHTAHLGCAEDVENLDAHLTAIPDKDTTVVKLSLQGTLSLRDKARADEILERHEHLFAGINVWDRHTNLAVLPDGGDLDSLGLTGYAADTAAQLGEIARSGSADAACAQDALGLLYRLSGAAR